MSDVQAPQGGGATDTVPPRDAVAAGQRIKQAREAAGLHVVALAAALKVPVKKLEALEAGRTDDLPDATFARALAASVCRQLKIDPTDVLAQLPQAGGSRLGEDPVLNTPFRSPRDPVGATRAPQGVPKAVWIALVILLSAAVVWWWVPPVSDDSPLVLPAEPLSPVEPTEGATSMGAGASVAEETAAPPSDASPSHAPATAVPATATSHPTPTPAGLGGTPAAAPATAQPNPAPAAPANEVLVIRAQSDSWIEVSGGGKVLVQRLIKSGDSIALAEPTPLSVVIGRADATAVLVHGKPFDLAAVARNNVARFEVK